MVSSTNCKGKRDIRGTYSLKEAESLRKPLWTILPGLFGDYIAREKLEAKLELFLKNINRISLIRK